MPPQARKRTRSQSPAPDAPQAPAGTAAAKAAAKADAKPAAKRTTKAAAKADAKPAAKRATKPAPEPDAAQQDGAPQDAQPLGDDVLDLLLNNEAPDPERELNVEEDAAEPQPPQTQVARPVKLTKTVKEVRDAQEADAERAAAAGTAIIPMTLDDGDVYEIKRAVKDMNALHRQHLEKQQQEAADAFTIHFAKSPEFEAAVKSGLAAYTLVVRCHVCAAHGKGAGWLFPRDSGRSIRGHYKRVDMKTLGLAPSEGSSGSATPNNAVDRAPKTDLPTEQFKLLKCFGYALARISLNCIEMLGRIDGLKIKEVYCDWKTVFMQCVERSAEKVRVLVRTRLTCITFDGGRWQHTGEHVLVTLAHNAEGAYVLPPITAAAAFDAESLRQLVTGMRTEVMVNVRHAVVDGATYNTAAIDGANAAVSDHRLRRLRQAEALAAEGPNVLLEAEIGGKDFYYEKNGDLHHLYCIAHWLVRRVREAEKNFTDPDEECTHKLLACVSQSLYSAHMTSARRTKLTQFLQARKTQQRAEDVAQIEETAALVDMFLEHVDSGEAPAMLADIRPLLISLFGAEDADVMAAHNDDKGSWQAAMESLKGRLQVLLSATETRSVAAGTATISDTRWHNCIFTALKFAGGNLPDLYEFFKEEKNPKAIELVELMAVAGMFERIQKTLDSYVPSMAPLAELLNEIADGQDALASVLLSKLTKLVTALKAQPHGSMGYAVGELVEKKLMEVPWGNLGPRCHPFHRTAHFLFYAQFLWPHQHVLACYQPWARKPGNRLLDNPDLDCRVTAKTMRTHLNLKEEELPDDEWYRYMANAPRVGHNGKSQRKYWADKVLRDAYPNVAAVADYVMAIPCVVTSCDQVLSVMGNQFTPQQSQLDNDKAAEIVAFRCNNDVCGTLNGFLPKSFRSSREPGAPRSLLSMTAGEFAAAAQKAFPALK